MKNLDAWNILVLNPTIFAAQNRDRMSAGDQMFRQKLAVRQRTVNVSTGGDLKDVQGTLAQIQRGGAIDSEDQCTDHL